MLTNAILSILKIYSVRIRVFFFKIIKLILNNICYISLFVAKYHSKTLEIVNNF